MFLASLIYENLHSQWHPYYTCEYLFFKKGGQIHFYYFCKILKCHSRQLKNPLIPLHYKLFVRGKKEVSFAK